MAEEMVEEMAEMEKSLKKAAKEYLQILLSGMSVEEINLLVLCLLMEEEND